MNGAYIGVVGPTESFLGETAFNNPQLEPACE